ncbi:MAG: rRNA pseudouridine synthase [Oscillospiraceae bacterium]|nr:rRNA pseudouridine synthase [Oscillospiraceae bacterium]
MEERLQKLLSAAGECSRRQAEGYIQAGRVTVNGQTAQLGDRADPARDRVELDGKPVLTRSGRTYIMLNKPRGYVTTLSDEKGRKTVAELVADCPARVWPVGRLDMDSEGLLLLTDDGALTHRLTHPAHQVEKEYQVRVTGDLERALPLLSAPVWSEGEELTADRVERTGRDTVTVVIHQGKNRQVRRMCAAAGLKVNRLRRVREGAVRLGGLRPGQWRPLTAAELAALQG